MLQIREVSDVDLARIDIYDGSVQDWEDVLGDATVTLRDEFVDTSSLEPYYDPSDFDFRIWIAWHDADDRLYFAVEWFDDEYVNDFSPETSRRGNEMLGHDGVLAFRVDTDRSGGNWNPSEDPTNVANQECYAIAETNDSGPHVGCWNRPVNWNQLPPYSDGGGARFGEKPTVTVLEFYFTPSDRIDFRDREARPVAPLHAGKKIDLWIGTLDVDRRRARGYGYQGRKQSKDLPLAVLVARSDGGGPSTAEAHLEQSGWAWIKEVHVREELWGAER